MQKGGFNWKVNPSVRGWLFSESCLLAFHTSGVKRHLYMLLVAVGSTRCISIPESPALLLFLSPTPGVSTVACLKNCLLLFLKLPNVSYGEKNNKGIPTCILYRLIFSLHSSKKRADLDSLQGKLNFWLCCLWSAL